ncbi:MAG: peptidylprolyl isomerase [Micromonosporaceae bacterium]|nr:peptidylprolyl isomerase [Micromonosporaceae bacterium]
MPGAPYRREKRTVTSFRDRQRAAARARLEREMAIRAEAARRRRRIKMIVSSSTAFVLIVGTVVVITVLATGDDGTPSAASSPAACAYQPALDPSAEPSPLPSTTKQVGIPPESMVVRSGVQLMTLNTSQGTMRVQVDTGKAPCTAASFTHLAGLKYFDNTKCHRMTTEGIYVLQCGDPTGTGMGGPDYTIPDENLPVGKVPTYPEGTVAMANAGANTNGSQFFIVYGDSELPASYTVLGHVLQGLDVVKKIAMAGVTPADPSTTGDGAPNLDVTITSMVMDPAAASLPSLPPVSVAPQASAPAAAATSAAP